MSHQHFSASSWMHILSGPRPAPENDRRVEPPVDKGGLKRHFREGGRIHPQPLGVPMMGFRYE
jgi:hypothetical protein